MTGKDPGEHYAELERRHGRSAYTRTDVAATPEQKDVLKKLSPEQVTSEAELQGLLDAGEHLLVWRDGGVTRACVRLVDLGDGLAYLGMLTVDPALQGEGLGKRLLAAAEGYAGEVLGARRMEMQVFSRRRELLSFYDRRGFRATGERRPFPYEQAPEAGALFDDLEFVVLEKAL